MLLLLQQNLGFAWGAGEYVPPAPEVTQNPAGKPKRKHLYYVEIDGQIFHAEDASHALAILDHAADLAYKAASREAEAVAAKIKTARRIGLAVPRIKTDAPIDLKPFRERIKTAYRNAAVDAELRMHMALAQAREDEEVAAMLLL